MGKTRINLLNWAAEWEPARSSHHATLCGDDLAGRSSLLLPLCQMPNDDRTHRSPSLVVRTRIAT